MHCSREVQGALTEGTYFGHATISHCMVKPSLLKIWRISWLSGMVVDRMPAMGSLAA